MKKRSKVSTRSKVRGFDGTSKNSRIVVIVVPVPRISTSSSPRVLPVGALLMLLVLLLLPAVPMRPLGLPVDSSSYSDAVVVAAAAASAEPAARRKRAPHPVPRRHPAHHGRGHVRAARRRRVARVRRRVGHSGVRGVRCVVRWCTLHEKGWLGGD